MLKVPEPGMPPAVIRSYFDLNANAVAMRDPTACADPWKFRLGPQGMPRLVATRTPKPCRIGLSMCIVEIQHGQTPWVRTRAGGSYPRPLSCRWADSSARTPARAAESPVGSALMF